MPQALVSLGSNLGDRPAILDRAAAALDSQACRLVARSSWYETAPVGGPLGQDVFLNGVVRLETSLEPHNLLARLQSLESESGRVRDAEWGPRTLDLDLLFYDDQVLDTPELVLPHPRAAFRRFVLDGAAAVAPDWRHPILDRSLAELLRHLVEAPRYVALVGANVGFRNQLASEGAHVASARLVEATDASLPASVDLVFCEGAVCDGPALNHPIEFIRGRAKAIEQSLAAGDDWFVDDTWLAAEAVELAARMPGRRRAEFAAACEEVLRKLPPPRLVASVVTAQVAGHELAAKGLAESGSARHESLRHGAAVAVRAAAPWRQVLPPIVDLVVADRERALAELAAAMEAAG
jgi:2-amino-4-hydroxy-6-hydroxymethyldihydropteridine diphosphokinase